MPATPKAEFGSVSRADRAVERFFEEPNGPPDSEAYTGSLSVPEEYTAGEGFSASATVKMKADYSAATESFALVLYPPEGLEDLGTKGIPLARKQLKMTPDVTQELNYTIEAGTLGKAPSADYRLSVMALEAHPGEVAYQEPFAISQPGEEKGDGSGDGSGKWAQAEKVRSLDYGWVLFTQKHKTEDRTRWFVAGKNSDGTVIYVAKGGEVQKGADNIAAFDTKEKALAAYRAWVERHENGETEEDEEPEEDDEPDEDDVDGDGPAWGAAQRVAELKYGWYLFRQDAKNQDKTRWMVAGKNNDGNLIYITTGGEVQTNDPFYFDTKDAAVQAFRAWVERASNGEADDDEFPDPSASPPSGSDVTKQTRRKDAAGSGGFLGSVADAAGDTAAFALDNPLIAVAGGTVIAYVAYTQVYGKEMSFDGFTDALEAWARDPLKHINMTIDELVEEVKEVFN